MRIGPLLCLLLAGAVAARAKPLAWAQNLLQRPEAMGWTELFARAGTPKSSVGALSAAIVNAMRVPQPREKFIGIGVEPTGTTPEAFAAIIAANIARWTPIAKASGLNPE